MATLGNLPLSFRPVRRLSALFLGLGLYGASMSLMIAANLGLDPWDVFHQGVSRLTGARFGWVVIATGAVVLLAWIPLRQRPALGTIANVVVIGLVVDAVNAVLPVPHEIWLRWAYGIFGVILTGVGSGLYIGARLGPGPRDGLMTGIVARYAGRRFASIRLVRTAIEVTVLAVGFLMGGKVGAVTVLFAVGIGPLAHLFIPIFAVREPAPVEPAREPVAV
jgi:uncharacterized membrane protein YczE